MKNLKGDNNMANTNTNNTNTTYTRFCSLCGAKFETVNKLTRLCDHCKNEQKKRVAEKQKEYAKKRSKDLNLTTIIVDKETRDKIKRLAKKDNVNMLTMITKIVNEYDKDNKDNIIAISDVKSTKKATTTKKTMKKTKIVSA